MKMINEINDTNIEPPEIEYDFDKKFGEYSIFTEFVPASTKIDLYVL